LGKRPIGNVARPRRKPQSAQANHLDFFETLHACVQCQGRWFRKSRCLFFCALVDAAAPAVFRETWATGWS